MIKLIELHKVRYDVINDDVNNLLLRSLPQF